MIVRKHPELSKILLTAGAAVALEAAFAPSMSMWGRNRSAQPGTHQLLDPAITRSAGVMS